MPNTNAEKFPPSLTTTTGRGQNGWERSRTTKKAVNLFQDLLLSLAASVAAGIQFLWLVRRIVKPELELTVN